METFKNIINQFKDPELLIIIACIVVGLILLRVLGNVLLRHKILKIAVVGLVVMGVVFGIIWFVENRKEFYSETSTNYVYGEVKNISSAVRKVELKVINSNVKLKNGDSITDKNVVVDIDMNCKFLDKSGNEISFDDISFYDVVRIYVKQENISDISKDTLTGVKLIQKNDYKLN